MKNACLLALVLSVITASGTVAGEVTAKDRAAVKNVLMEERKDFSKSPWEIHAERLTSRGASAIATLETFLTDPDLGGDAAETMLTLDRDAAAPLIFASMPRSDRNIQFHTFKLFIRLIQEGTKITCQKDMHDAAVRCLEADTNADAGEQALYAIGLTGDTSDFLLLQKLFDNTHPTPFWKARLRHAAEAALARLGSQAHVAGIKDQLSRAIPTPFTRDDAVSLVAALGAAGFTKNREFVPFVRAHLKTPSPEPRTDEIISPAYAAETALDEILGKDWRTKDRPGR